MDPDLLVMNPSLLLELVRRQVNDPRLDVASLGTALRARAAGLTLRVVARLLGVHVATLCRWQERSPELRAALDRAAEEARERRRRLGVDRFTFKANTPVQGTGADGLKLALALLWERRHERPDAFAVLAVHDEIVVECDEDEADAAADWLRRAMLDAMAPLIDPVPVEVEVKVGKTWGG